MFIGGGCSYIHIFTCALLISFESFEKKFLFKRGQLSTTEYMNTHTCGEGMMNGLFVQDRYDATLSQAVGLDKQEEDAKSSKLNKVGLSYNVRQKRLDSQILMYRTQIGDSVDGILRSGVRRGLR